MTSLGPTLIDFEATIPTELSQRLRAAAAHAAQRAADPLNALDNNPFIAREWLLVSTELHKLAVRLDRRLETLFGSASAA
jgi:hypothetical protein